MWAAGHMGAAELTRWSRKGHTMPGPVAAGQRSEDAWQGQESVPLRGQLVRFKSIWP